MKDLFYGILSFILILALLGLFTVSKHYKPQYIMPENLKGGIIVNKIEFLQEFQVVKNDTIHDVDCYDILWEKYNIGDTIVNCQLISFKPNARTSVPR